MSRREPEAVTAMRCEAERWPEVSIRFEKGGKHGVAVVSFRGRSRRFGHSLTPSCPFAAKKAAADLRRTLRALGASTERASHGETRPTA